MQELLLINQQHIMRAIANELFLFHKAAGIGKVYLIGHEPRL